MLRIDVLKIKLFFYLYSTFFGAIDGVAEIFRRADDSHLQIAFHARILANRDLLPSIRVIQRVSLEARLVDTHVFPTLLGDFFASIGGDTFQASDEFFMRDDNFGPLS